MIRIFLWLFNFLTVWKLRKINFEESNKPMEFPPQAVLGNLGRITSPHGTDEDLHDEEDEVSSLMGTTVL